MRFVARKLSPFSNSCSSPSIPDIVKSLSIPFKRVRDEGPHVLGMMIRSTSVTSKTEANVR